MEKKRTVSQERRIAVYPSPKVYGMIEDYRVKNGFTRSEAVEYIARQFFESKEPKATPTPQRGRNQY